MNPAAQGDRGSARLDRDSVGHRVTIRVLAEGRGPSGGQAQRDLVGILEDADPARIVVRRLDGTTEGIERNRIVLTKVLGSSTRRIRRAADIGDAELERIAARGWQPSEQVLLGDWLLRAAAGFTGRANSVLPLGNSGLDLDEALEQISRWYAARSLPAQVQVPTPYADELASALLQRGWTAFNPTQVLVADVRELRTQMRRKVADVAVRTSDIPDAQWLATYNYRGQSLPPIAAQVLTNTDQPLFFSATRKDDDPPGTVAVARAAVTGSWAGVTALEVAPDARRSGVASHLVSFIVAHVARRGVRHIYLQVADENTAALAFYSQFGFTVHHGYHYARQHTP